MQNIKRDKRTVYNKTIDENFSMHTTGCLSFVKFKKHSVIGDTFLLGQNKNKNKKILNSNLAIELLSTVNNTIF